MAVEGRGSPLAMLLSLLFISFSVVVRSLLGSIYLGSRFFFIRFTKVDQRAAKASVTMEKNGLRSEVLSGREEQPNGEGIAEPSKRFQFALYEGRVFHVRHQPISRRFRYTLRHALINLEDPPAWFADSARHHLSFKQSQAISGTNGPVYLLTTPTSFGYEQNPISVYYCYNSGGNVLLKCIAEVTNTPWGERVTFVFDPKSDVVAKLLHVSPFMDALGQWKIQASSPDQHLLVNVYVQHPELGNYFTATLTSERVESTLYDAKAFSWLMPQRVTVWIYWQAILLLWKGVTFYSHPKYAFDSGVGPWPLQSERAQSLCKEGNLDGWVGAAPVTVQQNLLAINQQRYCAWREASSWPWK